MIKTLLLASTALILFTGCWGEPKPEVWTAYIYPDKTNTKRSLEIKGKYPTIEKCKEASLLALSKLGHENGDYKCGLHCEYHDGMKTEICEKLAK